MTHFKQSRAATPPLGDLVRQGREGRQGSKVGSRQHPDVQGCFCWDCSLQASDPMPGKRMPPPPLGP